MKASAPTRIYCQTADPADNWIVQAASRRDAEMFYMNAIVTGKRPPPMVRFIAQLKVDQADYTTSPSLAVH